VITDQVPDQSAWLRREVDRQLIERHTSVVATGTNATTHLPHDCEGPEPELHRMYVEPALKRRGLGSALLGELHRRLPPGASYILMVVAANRSAVCFYERHGLVEAAQVDGVTSMHERMGVDFRPGAPAVPALVLRFTKPGRRVP